MRKPTVTSGLGLWLVLLVTLAHFLCGGAANARVLCFGGNGHVQFETLAAGCADAIITSAVPVPAESSLQSLQSRHGGPCSDVALGTALLNQQDGHWLDGLTIPESATLVAWLAVIVAMGLQRSPLRLPRPPRHALRLLSLHRRTVVLLN